MNYYKEYENLEIPLYKMPKPKKNTSVCQWSSTRPIKTTATPKKNLVIQTCEKLANESLVECVEENKNETISTSNETKLEDTNNITF